MTNKRSPALRELHGDFSKESPPGLPSSKRRDRVRRSRARYTVCARRRGSHSSSWPTWLERAKRLSPGWRTTTTVGTPCLCSGASRPRAGSVWKSGSWRKKGVEALHDHREGPTVLYGERGDLRWVHRERRCQSSRPRRKNAQRERQPPVSSAQARWGAPARRSRQSQARHLISSPQRLRM